VSEPCATCGVDPCPVAGAYAGGDGDGCHRWKRRVRRPKDMCCVLSKLGKGGNCHGSRCYLWSRLGPEEETGTPGTCLMALALTKLVGDDATHGVAMEEGSDL